MIYNLRRCVACTLLSLVAPLHKGRQVEWVASILGTEDAQKEAVHNQENAAPGPDSDNLGPGIGNPGNLDGQRDGGKGEDTIYTVIYSQRFPKANKR